MDHAHAETWTRLPSHARRCAAARELTLMNPGRSRIAFGLRSAIKYAMRGRFLTHLRTLAILVIASLAGSAAGQLPPGGGFTYQGHLGSGGGPVIGTADIEFRLWDAPAAGAQVGAVVALNNVTVVDGLFTAEVNAGGQFGASAFDGNARWLEIAVRSPAGGGAFTTLSPRQPLVLKANNQRGLQLQYAHDPVFNATGDSVLGGYWLNSNTPDAVGATVFGGETYRGVPASTGRPIISQR